MTARSKGGKRAKARPKLALIFGESDNDTKTVEVLLRALRPDLDWKIEARRRPPILIKDAKPEDLPSRVERIAALVRVAEVDADVVVVVAHEDCDEVDPAHEDLAVKIRAAFAEEAFQVEPAVPAWEMETWLMQWPDAFPQHVRSWRSVAHYEGKNVGLIRNAKEDLQRALRARSGAREYRESDAPDIARIVAAHGWARLPKAQSKSYALFVQGVDGLEQSGGQLDTTPA